MAVSWNGGHRSVVVVQASGIVRGCPVDSAVRRRGYRFVVESLDSGRRNCRRCRAKCVADQHGQHCKLLEVVGALKTATVVVEAGYPQKYVVVRKLEERAVVRIEYYQ